MNTNRIYRVAVIPGDGKLVSYLLNLRWFEPH